ncbi:hypothetical protein Tco_0085984 [Tanacetum coccineum]
MTVNLISSRLAGTHLVRGLDNDSPAIVLDEDLRSPKTYLQPYVLEIKEFCTLTNSQQRSYDEGFRGLECKLLTGIRFSLEFSSVKSKEAFREMWELALVLGKFRYKQLLSKSIRWSANVWYN